jgi:putative N6-adenine-specific DNA methylase
VAQELSALGERPRIEEGGVSWQGDTRSMMRANLWLRAASRVVIRIAQFRATAFFELEKSAKRIPWSQFLMPGQAAEFRVTAKKSKLYHSDAIAERLQKAVATPQRIAQSPQLFVVRAFHDEFTISVDTSGELLHMRGYRQAVGKAPLRETLAAALLLAADWDGRTPLLDPFCGSGTIPIEAALIARRMAPGLQRRFAFMEWPNFDAKAWRRLTEESKNAELASSPALILGSDRDAGAVASSRANAERAGVSSDVEFQASAISAIEPPSTPGLIATNPPYGVRVSEGATVRNLYARFGQVLRTRCFGWRATLYCPDPRFAAAIEVPFRELFRTTNGGIKVAALLVDGTKSGLERP